MAADSTPRPRVRHFRRSASYTPALALGLVTLSSCSAIFGIELLPLRHDEGSAGETGGASDEAGSTGVAGEVTNGGGQAGKAGSGNGGSSGKGDAGKGDAGDGIGAASGSEGKSGAAGASGSNGGRGDSGSSGSAGNSGGTAGTSGSAGSGGTASVPPFYAKHGETCSESGHFACDRVFGYSLLCQEGVWINHAACSPGVCDPRTGVCGSAHDRCTNRQPGARFCDFTGYISLVTCDPLNLSAEIEYCVLGCDVVQNECYESSGTQLIVEQGAARLGTYPYWPVTTIPVCFQEPNRPEWDEIRQEIGETWSRFSGLTFTGWDACGASSTGVKVTLTDPAAPCDNELASLAPIGYPGAGGSVELRLCTAYYLESHAEQTSTALLRLTARHQFAHVLAFKDIYWGIDTSGSEFLAPAVELSHLDDYPFTPDHIGRLQNIYGRKAPGAFVNRYGECLTANDGTLAFAPCGEGRDQLFSVVNDAIRHPNDDTCLSAAPDGSIELAPCASQSSGAAQAFRLSASEIRGFGGYCLMNDDSNGDNEWPSAQICPPFGSDARALWSAEFFDGAQRLRVQNQGNGKCLQVTGGEDGSSFNTVFGPCDECAEGDSACGTSDRFELTRSGQMVHDGRRCLAESSSKDDPVAGFSELPRSGSIAALPCSIERAQSWSLASRFEHRDGDEVTALTLVREGTSEKLALRPVGEGEDLDQIFDSYFPSEL